MKRRNGWLPAAAICLALGAFFGLALIESHGGDAAGPVALISSDYHMHRLCVVARSLGCEPVRVAARTGYLALRANYAVREAFAMWRIWVLGPG